MQPAACHVTSQVGSASDSAHKATKGIAQAAGSCVYLCKARAAQVLVQEVCMQDLDAGGAQPLHVAAQRSSTLLVTVKCMNVPLVAHESCMHRQAWSVGISVRRGWLSWRSRERSQPRKMIRSNHHLASPAKTLRMLRLLASSQTLSHCSLSQLSAGQGQAKPARWLVLLPGAAHASTTCQPGCGSSMWAGRQDARLCMHSSPSVGLMLWLAAASAALGQQQATCSTRRPSWTAG